MKRSPNDRMAAAKETRLKTQNEVWANDPNMVMAATKDKVYWGLIRKGLESIVDPKLWDLPEGYVVALKWSDFSVAFSNRRAFEDFLKEYRR